MRSLLIVRREKRILTLGAWHSGKRMPRNAFPLSKSHSYVLGSSYDWSVSEAECGLHRYRVLVALDVAKSQYRGWLGVVRGTDQALIARLEFHPTHHGWHCHLKLGELDRVVCGVVKDSRAHERTKICKVKHEFHTTQLDARNIAFRVFNIVGTSLESEWGLIP